MRIEYRRATQYNHILSRTHVILAPRYTSPGLTHGARKEEVERPTHHDGLANETSVAYEIEISEALLPSSCLDKGHNSIADVFVLLGRFSGARWFICDHVVLGSPRESWTPVGHILGHVRFGVNVGVRVKGVRVKVRAGGTGNFGGNVIRHGLASVEDVDISRNWSR